MQTHVEIIIDTNLTVLTTACLWCHLWSIFLHLSIKSSSGVNLAPYFINYSHKTWIFICPLISLLDDTVLPFLWSKFLFNIIAHIHCKKSHLQNNCKKSGAKWIFCVRMQRIFLLKIVTRSMISNINQIFYETLIINYNNVVLMSVEWIEKHQICINYKFFYAYLSYTFVFKI